MSYTDLQIDIDNGVICADISDNCFVVTIEPDLVDPIIAWPNPLEICEDSLYTIPITNYDPALTYLISVQSGSFSQLFFDDINGEINLEANAGPPIEICVSIEGDCNGENCAVLSVIQGRPLPIFAEVTSICSDGSGLVLVDNAVAGDVYTWTISGPGIITMVVNTSVEVTATGVSVIQVCASIPDICGPVENCYDIPIIFVPPPSTNALPTYCLGTNFFNGNANGSSTSILWEQLSGPGTITFVNPNVVATQWSVDVPGTYVIRLNKELDGCEAFDEVTIEVIDGPTVAEVVTCINGEFVIELTFSGGTPPYLVFGTPIVGNVYTSPPYPNGSAVLTPFEDANGCGSDFFVQEFCSCTTDAGTMSTTLLEFCDQSSLATGIYNGDATFDADDIGKYILHTSAIDILGTIIEINDTGVFGFQPPMVLGFPYYISYVVGTDDGTGQIDFGDLCLSVSVGQPVIWYPDVIISQIVESDPVFVTFL